MALTCIINNQDTFKLVKWNSYDFRDNLTLILQTIDLQAVKTACSHIDKIEIYRDDNLIAMFTEFDTFSSMNYLGTLFVEEEHIFTDALSVTLTRANIVEQVKRLEAQINPVINIESMTLNEYKQYQLDLVSEQCTASIYSGDIVQLSDGTVEHFSFTDKDQADLQSLSSIAMLDPTIELTWHSDGHLCRFYSGVDIILIYQRLNMKLFRETTICNAINLLIRNAQSKDEVYGYYWGCELPAEDQQRVDDLISRMGAIVGELIRQFVPDDVIPSNNDDNQEPSTDGEDDNDDIIEDDVIEDDENN